MNRLRQLKKSDWIAIALTGVLILIIAMPLSPKQSDSESTEGQETAAAVLDSGSMQGSQNVYAAAMEKRLKQVLGQMEGVGETEVMITLSDSGETIVEKKIRKNRRTVSRKVMPVEEPVQRRSRRRRRQRYIWKTAVKSILM